MSRNADVIFEELQFTDEDRQARRRLERERRAVLETYRDYPVVDCDQHYYEPDDCFTRHLEPKYQDEAIIVRRDGPDGLGRLYRAGKRFRHTPGPPGEKTARPGALRDYFKNDGTFTSANSGEVRSADYPEFVDDREARLLVMERHDVQAAIMLPTLGVLVESECCGKKDIAPDVWFGLMRSFNRWLEETWGFGADGRFFGAPLVSLYDPGLAVEELERLITAGARVVILRAGSAYGHSPADPMFDPFWARVQEAGLVVGFHVGDSGYQDFFAPEWGYGNDHYPAGASNPFEVLTCGGERAISDTLAALIFGNLLGRFPGLRFLILELGSTWLPLLLKKMDLTQRSKNRPGVRLDELPSTIYKQHFWISPYHEDPWAEIIDCVGASRVCLGSDWPHPEGLPEPLDLLEDIGMVTPGDLRLILRDNTASLLGIG